MSEMSQGTIESGRSSEIKGLQVKLLFFKCVMNNFRIVYHNFSNH